jgi:ADP-heptose:LPS heptosyltransferase
MGSIVLAYSLFKKAVSLFPEAELYFLTFQDNRYAVDLMDIIPEENVFTVRSGSLFTFSGSFLRMIMRIRKKKIDTVIDMELFARATAVLSYLSRARNRIGYHRFNNEGLYRGNFLTHRVALNPHIHMAHNFLNLIEAVSAPAGETPLVKRTVRSRDIVLPRRASPPEEIEKIRKKLEDLNPHVSGARKLVLLNPNASEMIPIRRWPLENYINLSRRLLELKDLFLIVTGVASERPEAEKICSTLNPDQCLNLAGRTTFRELLTLYAISDILITNDSGPVHFSSMTDIRTFVFFGPETPKLYGPLGKNSVVFYSNFACSPCVSASNHRKSACTDNKCLQAIEVEEVFQTLQSFIKENSRSRSPQKIK